MLSSQLSVEQQEEVEAELAQLAAQSAPVAAAEHTPERYDVALPTAPTGTPAFNKPEPAATPSTHRMAELA